MLANHSSRSVSLAHCLLTHAEKTPGAVALHLGSKQVDYASLADECARRAATLKAFGLPERTIIVLAGTAHELMQTLLACQWANHPFLPLDPATADSRWMALLAADATDKPRVTKIPPDTAQARLFRLHQAPAASCRQDRQEATAILADPENRSALIVSTSGSEGTPKSVQLSHAALMAAAEASAARIPLLPGDVWLNCLPLHHIGGLSIFWRCFASGAAIRLHENFDAAAVWADIAAGRASHVSLVPAMLARLLDASGNSPPPPTLRCALIGGAALSRPLWQRAHANGWPLFTSYGMSETAAQVATLPPDDDWQEGLVGQALPGMDIAISDNGFIQVRGPQLMLGYLDATDSPITDGWLRTGDLGRIDQAGRLYVLGRGDDMLVSGGENIHPLEIETLLAACPGITDVAVTATHDPVWGDIITALVVGTAEPASIDAWSREHLPAKLRPRRMLRVQALPRNALGKLERPQLHDLLDKVAA